MNYIYNTAILLATSIILLGSDYFYHKEKFYKYSPEIVSKRFFDHFHPSSGLLITTFPFVAHWILIVWSVYTASHYPSPIVLLILVIFVGIQMRALHELTHHAVHRTLCSNSLFGDWLADYLFHYPFLMNSVAVRRPAHFKHHSCSNTKHDPNIIMFREIGFEPIISKSKFIYYLFYPITLVGLWGAVQTLPTFFRLSENIDVIPRATVHIMVLIAAHEIGVLNEYLMIVVPARFIVYPFLTWISLLVEHRWFVDTSRDEGQFNREYTVGRPTVYRGVIGALSKIIYFPYADHLHLAHSLNQNLRYNYLPFLDKYLMKNDREYSKYYSVNLLKPGERQSALSELYSRMING